MSIFTLCFPPCFIVLYARQKKHYISKMLYNSDSVSSVRALEKALKHTYYIVCCSFVLFSNRVFLMSVFDPIPNKKLSDYFKDKGDDDV